MADPETPLYSVLLLNDHETPMEFVVHVLEVFFDMERDPAMKKMLAIHHQGIAVCGSYPYETAKELTAEITAFARKHGHPLQCACEKTLRTPEA